MKRIEQILELAAANNGIVTARTVDKQEVPRALLSYLVEQGKLERVGRGVYALPDSWDDELFTLQRRFTRGIYAGETALYLHGLTDVMPVQWEMTFPLGYNLTSAKAAGVRCNQERNTYDLGVHQARTPSGNAVAVYSAEKTLCDLLRPKRHYDIRLITDAYRTYIRWENRDIPALSEYARVVGVEAKVRAYLEVLV